MGWKSQINNRTIKSLYLSTGGGLREITDVYNVTGSGLRRWAKTGSWQPWEHYFILDETDHMKIATEAARAIITE